MAEARSAAVWDWSQVHGKAGGAFDEIIGAPELPLGPQLDAWSVDQTLEVWFLLCLFEDSIASR